mgnify:CR=1 FL=1
MSCREINRFAESLAQTPGVGDVKVTRMPLNISPGLTLSGNTTDNRDMPDICLQHMAAVMLLDKTATFAAADAGCFFCHLYSCLSVSTPP